MKCVHAFEFIAESRQTNEDVEWCPYCGALQYRDKIHLPKPKKEKK